MKNVLFSLLIKNCCLRILCFLILAIIGNIGIFIRKQPFNPSIILVFNFIILGIFLILNSCDWLIMDWSKQKITKFSKWLFSNKLLSKETTKNQHFNQQIKYLMHKKNWFLWPFWKPIIVIPNGIMLFYFPILIFSLVILMTGIFNLILSLIIFKIIVGITIIIINLWSKNVNDAMKIDNHTWIKIEQEISELDVIYKNKQLYQKSWGIFLLKLMLVIFTISFFTLSLLTLVVGTKTFFSDAEYTLNQLPYFEEWTLNIFLIENWKNALFVFFWGWFFWIWTLSLWSFIKTEWYLLITWRNQYLWFNILTLNFIILFLWSWRFHDEEKIDTIIKEINQMNNQETSDQHFATTTSIINQKHQDLKLKKKKNQEQIKTRVIPLDENKKNKRNFF